MRWARPALLLCLLCTCCAASPSLVDSEGDSAFALYRSGRLSRQEMTALCADGVEEIVVLSGDAHVLECNALRSVCPRLRVRYSERQYPQRPLDAAFLAAFDRWVDEARAADRKIAFRCKHGWHRAGRLAAYYRMKHQGADPQDAIAEMNEIGRFMERHPELEPQVLALADHIAGRHCSTAPEHCVREAESVADAAFPADVCR